jgi:glyoxylase-like metal-dependent hydrolase (beta-lactamase superfamily II)
MPPHTVSRPIADFWVCRTCGADFDPSPTAPASCPVCEDERQWVPPTGPRLATRGQLAAEGTRTVLRPIQDSVIGLGAEPGLGVGHRGVLVRTGAGNLLWDPPGFLDEAAVAEVERLGGIAVVASSHPHMYGAAVEWADLFDASIDLPEVDVPWLQRSTERVRAWSGEHRPLPGLTIVQTGGHFPGSAVLHLAGGGGTLFTGDTIMVTPGCDRVTFMFSAPNRLPLPERLVRRVVAAVEPLEFDTLHGGWWDLTIRAGAKDVLRRDAERYIGYLRGDLPEYD